MTSSPPISSRQSQDELLDVLIIGGGIVGAGIARDAAMRGLRTKLIEQNDFASGTSSRSSRLLHGGIRYLAQAKIGLVYEASREKTVLHRIAPHLSEPMPFIFPTRSKSPWTYWKLSLGVKIYDWLCGKANLGKSESLSKQATIDLLPGLATENLTGSVRYFDGFTNDARLVIDTLRSATSHGAIVENYTKFVDSSRSDDIWQSTVETNDFRLPRQEFKLMARCVINATGPWSHRLPKSRTALRLTKGVHLVVERSRLPVPEAVVIAEGQRILFAIPWGNRVILGTTDTDYNGPIASPQCTSEDRDYVLSAINTAFPIANLTGADVLSDWAGLRPLVADNHGNPSDISRRHEITMSHPGWWDVTGGKLTTYRIMAEETVDSIVDRLGADCQPCKTDSIPLLSSNQDSEPSGILPPEVTQAFVEHFCTQEWARHLDDVMVRRTSWRYYHSNHLEIAKQVATWMGDCLDWSSDVKEQQLNEYIKQSRKTTIPAPHHTQQIARAVQAT